MRMQSFQALDILDNLIINIMKAFRLLATSLLVVSSVGLISCGEDELKQISQPIDIVTENLAKYGIDPNNYEFFEAMTTKNGEMIASGLLSDQYLWMGVFDTLTYQKLYEVKDEEITEKKINKYIGYGEYADLSLGKISASGLAPTENGYIAQFVLYYENKEEMFALKQHCTFFKGSELKKTTVTLEDNLGGDNLLKWYKDAAMLGNWNNWTCCKDNGDTLYTTTYPLNPLDDFVVISYTDIVLLGLHPCRYNLATENTVWSAEIIPPFDVSSDTKCSISVLESTSNIWKCKADLLYYDGTKKDYTFYLNIDNGTISESPNAYPLIGKWLYTTEAGNKEIITFNSNNTGSWESIDIYDNSSSTDTFSYTVNGNEFIIDFGDGSPETYRYEIADNEMKLTYEEGHTEVYSKQ